MSDRLPLEGVRVADFSWVWAGPICARILGALGAEVIKVTSRRRLDPSARTRGLFVSLNLNKRCCTINTAEPEGLDLARQLVSISDILVENYGHGAMERMGLGYEELLRWRPDLVYLSSSGLGRTGPDREKTAYGTLISGYTGQSSITGLDGGDPVIVGLTDPLVGMTQVYIGIACLYRREETGQGELVDLSMAEATTALLLEPLMDYAMNQRVQGTMGNRDEFMAPHGAFRCQGDDKWVAIAVATDAQWQALCRVVGRADLARDPKYATALQRWLRQNEMAAEITAWTMGLTNTEAEKRLQSEGVPAGASVRAKELADDPQLQARGFVEWIEQDGQRRPVVGLPWPKDSGPAWRAFAAPTVAQDNDFVFRELLGVPQEDIERLVETKVIY